MTGKYYFVDFTASTGGSVRVKAKSKKEAFEKVRDYAGDTDEQVSDCLHNTRVHEFDVKFDSRSVEEDSEQDDIGPGADEEE